MAGELAKYIKDFRAGDTKAFKLLRDTRTELGEITPINITGNIYTFSLAEDFDSEPVFSFVAKVGDHPLDNGITGVVYFNITSDMTRQIPPGKYFYDVQEQAQGLNGECVVSTIVPPIKEYKDRLQVFPDISPETNCEKI